MYFYDCVILMLIQILKKYNLLNHKKVSTRLNLVLTFKDW